MTLPVNASLMLVLSVVVSSPWLQLELTWWVGKQLMEQRKFLLSFLSGD